MKPCKTCGKMFTPTGQYSRICLKCCEESIQRAVKLRAINKKNKELKDGTMWVTCKTCGKEFRKYCESKQGVRRLGKGIRSSINVNCGKECSRKYTTLKQAGKIK